MDKDKKLALFIGIGIALCIGSIVMLISDIKFIKIAEKNDAKIVDIEHRPKHGSYHIVEFSVDNKIYSGHIYALNNFSKNLGDTITIYYNSNDPNDFRSLSVLSVVFCGVLGIISLFAGAIPIVKQKGIKKHCNKKTKMRR